MEEVKGEDFGKRYPSLPPNYVSLVQLKERWIQQKQKEAAQKQKIASSGNQQQQPKEDNRFNGSRRSSYKNGLGRNHAQGLHAPRNGELRVDSDTGFVPRRQSDRNHGKIREESKRQRKSSKVELRASELAGGSESRNAKDKKFNRWKSRGPAVKKEGLGGVHPVQTLSGNGVTSGGEEGYTSYENERVNEIVSVCMGGLAPEIKGKEENPMGSSRKPPGKQVLDHHFRDSTDSLRVEAISLGKQVVDDQLFSTRDSRILEAKPRGQKSANGQFYNTNNDGRIAAEYCGKEAVNGQLLNNAAAEGSVKEFEALPSSVSVDEIFGARERRSRRHNNKYERYKRSGNDKGLSGQMNAFKQEVFRDNEEEEVSLGEGRKAGEEKFGRFQGNEGNSRINRNYNEIRLKQGQGLVGEDISMGKEERTNDPEARTDKGAQAYRNKNRDCHWLGKDFGDLSIHGGRKGNSSRGHRWRHGNLGIDPHRNGKQVYDGLVWVKKRGET